MNEDMNMKELIRWSNLLKKLGYNSDEVLKAFEYVESGNEKILDEIIEEVNAAKEKQQ